MYLPPTTFYARPAGMYEELRGGVEAMILRRRNNTGELETAILRSLQTGFNNTIKRERLGIAPLALKIKEENLA